MRYLDIQSGPTRLVVRRHSGPLIITAASSCATFILFMVPSLLQRHLSLWMRCSGIVAAFVLVITCVLATHRQLREKNVLILDRETEQAEGSQGPLCRLDEITSVMVQDTSICLVHNGVRTPCLALNGTRPSREEADHAAKVVGEFLGVTAY
jgi:hypothetical protein